MAVNPKEVSGSDQAASQGTATEANGSKPVGVGGQTASSQAAPTSRCRPACTSPEEVFVVANALAALFSSQLTQNQLQTLINLLSLLIAGLSTIVTQQQICQGVEVIQTPVE